jgi:hypothetical protein
MRRYRCNNNKQRWMDRAVGEALARLYINGEMAGFHGRTKKRERWSQMQ